MKKWRRPNFQLRPWLHKGISPHISIFKVNQNGKLTFSVRVSVSDASLVFGWRHSWWCPCHRRLAGSCWGVGVSAASHGGSCVPCLQPDAPSFKRATPTLPAGFLAKSLALGDSNTFAHSLVILFGKWRVCCLFDQVHDFQGCSFPQSIHSWMADFQKLQLLHV